MSKFLSITSCWLLYVHVQYMYSTCTVHVHFPYLYTCTLITLMYDYMCMYMYMYMCMYIYMYMCVVHVYGFVWPLFYHFLIGINQVYTSSHFILVVHIRVHTLCITRTRRLYP